MVELNFPPSDVALTSLTRLGEGRQAEVFAWTEAEVVKLFRGAEATGTATREATAMRAAEASGVPMARLRGTVTIGGRPGIVMERLDGPDQLTLLGSRPWRIWGAAKTLARLHAQLHSAPVGAGLQSLNEAVRVSLESSERIPEPYRRAALDALERLPDGNNVCHGDFHPGNIIETVAGPRVIDWTAVTRGDPLADVARTLLLARAGELPPGTPLLVRRLITVGRRVLLWGYLREYRRLHPFEPKDLVAWEVVNAAERLSDGIPEERGYLLGLLARLVPATPPR